MADTRAAIDAYVQALAAAQPGKLEPLLDLCSEAVEFRDPFNKSTSKEGFQRILEHMFAKVGDLRFDAHEVWGGGQSWVLKWTFTGRVRLIGKISIAGLSEVRLNDDLLVSHHVDYWDSWGPVFCRIPVFGPLARILARPLKV